MSSSRSGFVIALAVGLACYPQPVYSPPPDTGQPCSSDSNKCASGVCADCLCSSHCATDAECLAGWTCTNPATLESHCACTPSAELCDGKDNDCNGIIDDAPETDQDCRQQGSGFACQAGKCECTGTSQCGGCVNLAIDPQHCGSCDNTCSAEGSAAPFCAASQCATIETVAPNNGGGPIVFAVDAEHLYLPDGGIDRIDQWSLTDGSHFKLAGSAGLVLSITADEGHVYWAVAANGAVYRVPIGGGETTQLASSQAPSFGLVVDETHVYWTAQPPIEMLQSGPGQVLKVPKEGGEITVVADLQDGPWGLAADATNLYWTNFNSGTVMKQAKAGGDPVVLASDQQGPTSITVDATTVYWTNAGQIDGVRDSDLNLKEPNVVPYTGSVMKVPIEGGTPVALASGQNVPSWGIAVDATHVYWNNSQMPLTRTKLGTLMRVPIAGGTPSTLVSEQRHAWGLALANGGIYWSAGDLVPYRKSPTNGKVQKLVLREEH